MNDPGPVSKPFDPPTAVDSSKPQPGTVEQKRTPVPAVSWFQRLSSILFIIFCFELGLFLLIYPWIAAWSDNYFAWAVPLFLQRPWNSLWNNAYVRGAVSGVGIANIWIAVNEIFRLFRRD